MTAGSTLTGSFTIFRDRNFSLYFSGQFISRLGNSINLLALVWLSHVLTNSTFQMSLVLVAGVIPRVLLAPVMGALVDRWPKRLAMVVTDASRCVLVMVLAISVYTDLVSIPVLVVFNILMSLFSTISMTALRVLQKQIVSEGQLLQANSLFQSSLNISQIAGPALAGVIIGFLGSGTAFAVDAATFAVSFLSLMMTSVKEPEIVKKPLTGLSILADIKAGTKVTMDIPSMRLMLPFMLLFNFLLSAVENLLIVQYVANVLHKGPGTVGLLSACMAVGELVGSLLLSFITARFKKERLMVFNMVVTALCLACIGLIQVVPVICALFFIAGFCMSIVNVVFFTSIQEAVPSQSLGVVFGMLGSVFEGVMPLGQLVFGGIAAVFAVGHVLTAVGVLAAAAGLGFMIKPAQQPPAPEDTTAEVS